MYSYIINVTIYNSIKKPANLNYGCTYFFRPTVTLYHISIAEYIHFSIPLEKEISFASPLVAFFVLARYVGYTQTFTLECNHGTCCYNNTIVMCHYDTPFFTVHLDW